MATGYEHLPISTFSHHSPLGDWCHSECVPTHLSHIVEKLWHFEGKMALLRERHFAKVYSEIILQLGPQFRDVHSDGRTGEEFPVSCVGGLTTLPSVIEAPSDRCHVIGIQLHAEGAYQLLEVPAAELANGTISLNDAAGPDTSNLADACFHAGSVEARFAIVCDWIATRLKKRSPAHLAVSWAAAQLRTSSGTAPVAALQLQTALSRTRFLSLFREQSGLTPKVYARILRFRNALSHLQRGETLTNSALKSGYYDQAHMYRDFSEFAHMTPADFAAANRFPGSLSLSESS